MIKIQYICRNNKLNKKLTIHSNSSMKKNEDSILEVCFLIRSYGKGELAMCYIHGVTQQAAVNRFNNWIRKAPGLEQRLLEMGMSRTGRNYTPAQVQAIVDAFGEP